MRKVKMILTNRFDPDVRVYKEAKYLVERGFDVEILCWDRENDYVDKEVEVVDGIRIKRFFPYSKYGTGLKQLKSFIGFVKECKKYLKNKEYQYLHCHDLDGVIAGYFARNNNSKLIFDMHEFYEVNGKKQKIRYLMRSIVNCLQNKSDYIIYVNDIQTSTMSSKNKQKLVYLPNYPEQKNYIGCEKSKSHRLRISYIGAVRQYNELKNLMDACNEMNDVEIYIHGAGVAHKRLKNIKGDYNNVFITGKYDFTQSAKLYSETDILYVLYPTSSIQYLTSYPVKFFEGIITKTPMIVNKGTVLEDFIKEYGIGFAVEGGNISEIRELVEYINKNRYILDEKVKNLEKIQYDYSWQEVVKNLDNIYI
ncbi:glycosyltransferase family 4 protein [Anaerosalibacter bizertensis]|uniref:Glycosyltransferase family 4 protein n=1 Tax=Anaerosalibacter bizertensis TaxID=932217 RepID=A0A844FKR2_9FIRM|nr:glycosyltransferase [Anaerosalibacter bizertensis]MBU5294107.1 glycosyltransferase [Anaerosalibacter bizertensis]MSS44468.1 glycosyltransferase family 4 protein [Anaerosalibacter bizertensis]